VIRKNDYIQLCNEQRAPDFEANVCIRCAQLECSRSIASRVSKFDDRTQNWHERLFTDVPRMAETDPRFSQISGQKFIDIPGRIPEVGLAPPSDWVDLNTTEPGVRAPPRKVGPPSPQPAPPEPSLEPEPPASSKLPLVRMINSPLQTSIMLDGANAAVAPATTDPWAVPIPPGHAPAPETGGVQKVKPGATIRFGGGGESKK